MRDVESIELLEVLRCGAAGDVDLAAGLLNDRWQKWQNVPEIARRRVRQAEYLTVGQSLARLRFRWIDLRRRVVHIYRLVVFLDVVQHDLQAGRPRELHVLPQFV